LIDASSSAKLIYVGQAKDILKFGERAFSNAGPATWNALTDHICIVADPAKFQKLLKSHYFSQAFNIC